MPDHVQQINTLGAAYLDKDYESPEMQYIRQAAKSDAVKLLWVLVGDCDYAISELPRYTAAYPIRKSLRSMTESEQETALKAIVECIKAAMIA